MTPLQTVRSGKVAVTVRIAGAGADICVLYFSGEIWYNEYMKNTKNFKTSNPEMVTISRAEYEKLLGHSQRLRTPPPAEREAFKAHIQKTGAGYTLSAIIGDFCPAKWCFSPGANSGR